MARPFNMNEAEDVDLNLLVDRFLQEKPDYLPVSGIDGSLYLLPYTGDWEFSENHCVLPESLGSDHPATLRPGKNQLLI